MKIRNLLVILGLCVLFAGQGLQVPVYAEAPGKTFTVDSALDEPDANYQDDKCKSTPSNKCTLRAAIMQANRSSDEDSIVLAANTTYKLTIGGEDGSSYKPESGDLDALSPMKIVGGDMYTTIIDGNQIDRIFQLHQPAHVSNLTLRNGKTAGNGGGILHDIDKPITVERVNFFNSHSDGSGGGMSVTYAGATVTNSRFEMNTANSYGGGIRAEGDLTISHTTFNKNAAVYPGGGLYIWDGTTVVTASTFSNNSASNGGGIFNHGILRAVNSTFSGNHVIGDGGGLLNDVTGTTGLYSVTIAKNTADQDAANGGRGGGIFNSSGIAIEVYNTIIATNTTLTPKPNFPFFLPHDCGGKFTSGGYNVIGNSYDCEGFTNNDLVGNPSTPINPHLAALLNYGGPTSTHGLHSTSVAIDAGNPGGCADGQGGMLAADQRSALRPLDGGKNGPRCDVGSFEFDPGTISCNLKPASPSLLSPTDGKVFSKRRINLDWSTVNCIEKYKVMVRQDAKKGPKKFKDMLTESEVKTDALDNGHLYYWRVKACNVGGCSKSTWFTFTIEP